VKDIDEGSMDDKKLYVVETKCPKGHLNLYRNLIKRYQNLGFEVVLVSNKRYISELKDVCDKYQIVSIEDSYRNKITYRINQIKALYRSLKTLPSGSKVLLLSYDTIAFSAVSFLFDLKITVLEHNNIDYLDKSIVKRIAYRIINRKVEHACFEKYICDYISSKYKKKSTVIQHPLCWEIGIRVKNKPFNKEYIFIPSAEVCLGFVKKLIFAAEKLNISIVTKYHKDLVPSPNLIMEKYFENYSEIFNSALAIGVGVDYKYRVSGVFYEGVAAQKRIIMKDCLYSNKMKAKYKDIVNIISSANEAVFEIEKLLKVRK
jgi:hypothetical protein